MSGGAKLKACQQRYTTIQTNAKHSLDELERSSNNFFGPTTGSFNLLLEGMAALGDELNAIGEPNANTPTAAAHPSIIAALRGIAQTKQRARDDSTKYCAAAAQLTHIIGDLDTLIADVGTIIRKKEGKILTQKTLPQLQGLARELGRCRGEWMLLTQVGPHRVTHALLT